MSLNHHLIKALRRRYYATAVGWVRAAIGAATMLRGYEALEIFAHVQKSYSLRTPYGPELPWLPQSWIPWLLGVWICAAAAFTIGWFTRTSGTILIIIIGYVLFLDQQTYSNHLYFLWLILILLVPADGGAAFSFDSHKDHRKTVPAWPVELLKIQLSLVYGFGAVAKINYSYLSGQLFEETVQQSLLALVPQSWKSAGLLSYLSYLSILMELFIAFGLWFRRTRWLAVSTGLVLHVLMVFTLTQSVVVQLQIFAVISLVLYGLFFLKPVKGTEGESLLSKRSGASPSANPLGVS